MAYNPTQLQLEELEAEEALKKKQWTPERFLIAIEEYCEKYDYAILDGLLEYCKENEIDTEFVTHDLMSDRLYALLQEDAEAKRLIKKTHKLTFE